jgi:hypothetical protein
MSPLPKEGPMSEAANTERLGATRRGIVAGAAALAPVSALVAGGADAATPDRGALQRAVENGKEASVRASAIGSPIPP